MPLDFHPALKAPAVSRYAVTTPNLLKWFSSPNRDLPYARQVKPFGFMVAFSANGFSEPSGASEGDIHKPRRRTGRKSKPIGPFDRNPARAADAAFDRETGKPVPRTALRSFASALAQYHLHPETKFHNGDYLDRGRTERRHISVASVHHIGKEANHWEEQFFLGLDRDSEVDYGQAPEAATKLDASLHSLTETMGQRQLAEVTGLSRSTIASLLKNGCDTGSLDDVKRLRARLDAAQLAHQQEALDQQGLVAFAKMEAERAGIANLARSLGCDVENLRKVLLGTRAPSRRLLKRLRGLAASIGH